MQTSLLTPIQGAGAVISPPGTTAAPVELDAPNLLRLNEAPGLHYSSAVPLDAAAMMITSGFGMPADSSTARAVGPKGDAAPVRFAVPSTNNPWIAELERQQATISAMYGENNALKDCIQIIRTDAAIFKAEFQAEEAKNKTFQNSLRELSEDHSKLKTTYMARVRELELRIRQLERENAAVTHNAAAHTEAISYNRRTVQDQLMDMDTKVALLLEALSAVPDARSTCIDDAIDFIKLQQRGGGNADVHAKLLAVCHALQVSPSLPAHELAVAAQDKLTEAHVKGLTQSGGSSASPLSREHAVPHGSSATYPAQRGSLLQTGSAGADTDTSALVAGSVPFAYGLARPDDATGIGSLNVNPPTHL